MADIELVIKIPEEIQLALINNIQLSMDQQSICDSYIKHAIVNGTPLPKEPIYMCGYKDGKSDGLNKIRAEIENHCGLIKENHCRYCSYCNCVMGVREILEIIEKYKAESEET